MMNLYRSLFIGRLPDENVFDILERLADEGYLKNNQQLKEFESCFLPISPFVEVICSMKNLEKLNLEYDLTLEHLALVFQSCSKLVELNISAFEFEMDKMTEDLIDKLRPGFQRLRCLDLFCFIDNDSWPRFQEMLT
jgi:hypothetical protein